jgi:hypothetical protein
MVTSTVLSAKQGSQKKGRPIWGGGVDALGGQENCSAFNAFVAFVAFIVSDKLECLG